MKRAVQISEVKSFSLHLEDKAVRIKIEMATSGSYPQ